MAHWLFKTEPEEFSIADLERSPNGVTRWDGIRNYQARNFIRDKIRINDQVWLYHSKTKHKGISGLARVVKEAYPDPAQWNRQSAYFDPKSEVISPKWYCVDIQHEQTFDSVISLEQLKQDPELCDMLLLKQGRLSIQPISEPEAKHLSSLIA